MKFGSFIFSWSFGILLWEIETDGTFYCKKVFLPLLFALFLHISPHSQERSYARLSVTESGRLSLSAQYRYRGLKFKKDSSLIKGFV